MQRIALLLVASAAYGAVIRRGVDFDETTGVGEVGKGDVQQVFGWNNADLQTNAEAVSFYLHVTQEWTAVCDWARGSSDAISGTLETETMIDAAVEYDTRENSQDQVTKFVLNGFTGTPTTTGNPPPTGGAECCLVRGTGMNPDVVFDGTCDGISSGKAGTWQTPVVVRSGGLFVAHDGVSHFLPSTTTTVAPPV